MTDQDNYRPRSPDFRIPPTAEYPLASPLDCAPYNYNTSPFFARQYHPPSGVPQPYIPPFTEAGFDSDMARRSSRLVPPPDTKYVDPVLPEEPPRPSPAAGIEVKTKFPVARIKRIMQADEDVGKVAQVTPIAVSKALELFMISLVTKAAKEAKDRNSKRVTASHLKQAVVKDEVLDFLADIIAKVPDQPGGGRKHEDDGSDQNEQPKRKRGGRRPKDDSD